MACRCRRPAARSPTFSGALTAIALAGLAFVAQLEVMPADPAPGPSAQPATAVPADPEDAVAPKERGDSAATPDPDGGAAPFGEAVFTTPGTVRWRVPDGVRRVAAVVIGAGGGGYYSGSHSTSGGGGGLAWRNAIPVAPGATLTVTVGRGGPSNPGLAGTRDGGTSRVGDLVGAHGGGGGRAHGHGGRGGRGFAGDASHRGGAGAARHAPGVRAGAAPDFPAETALLGSPTPAGTAGGGQAAGYYANGLDGASSGRRGGGTGLFCGPNDGQTRKAFSDRFAGALGGGGWTRATAGAAGRGAGGGVRIIWGEGRAFPDADCSQTYSYGNIARY